MVDVLFYSPVKDVNLFNYTGFYQLDKKAMESLGWSVRFTNKWTDVAYGRYDVLFTYFWTYSAVAALIAHLRGKCVISTGGADMIAPDFNLNKRSRTIHSIIFAAMSIFTDSILAVSRSDVINMQRIIGKHKKIRHSVHPVELSSRGSHNQQRKLQICTIAWMSTVSNVTRKGLDRLLLVAKELREYDEFRNLDVIIMGTEGEGTVYLKEIINREKIERVHFMGVIDDSTKLRVLAESKFYGQFSQYEGFGLAALEALNAGCTVIHSGRGGLSDVIGTHGIRINLDQNDKEIAESIVKQLKSFKSNEAQLEQDLRNFDLAARARDIANAVRRNYGVN